MGFAKNILVDDLKIVKNDVFSVLRPAGGGSHHHRHSGTMLDWALRYRVIGGIFFVIFLLKLMKIFVSDLSKIVVYVLDEADVMMSQQGHQDQSIRLNTYVHAAFLL